MTTGEYLALSMLRLPKVQASTLSALDEVLDYNKGWAISWMRSPSNLNWRSETASSLMWWTTTSAVPSLPYLHWSALTPEMDLQGKSVTDVAEKMEELQEKYPTVDLSQLADIDKVDAYIESLDLFAAPYTEEVEKFSKLTWMGCSDGSYILQIPENKALKDAKAFAQFKHEHLQITPNELDEYELSISSVSVQDKKLGIYNTLKEAFESADEVMQRCRPDRMKLVTREAEWHTYPASEPAKKLLRSLSKAKPVLFCLCPNPNHKTLPTLCPVCRLATGITAGQASVAINLLKTRRKQ